MTDHVTICFGSVTTRVIVDGKCPSLPSILAEAAIIQFRHREAITLLVASLDLAINATKGVRKNTYVEYLDKLQDALSEFRECTGDTWIEFEDDD